MSRLAVGPAAPTIPAPRGSDQAETFSAIAERVATSAPRWTPDQLARIGAVLDAGTEIPAVAS